ncbi:hypothetical protein H7J86_24250 [Mycobacterium hackensackense]|uniref:DUF7352 domain-containing protein n=1 Tax=Mycobacterium hackensackense TaxID=228909 RepID=UPI002265C33E|nr:hypothetical protein [Mycobacterium hackensackense]MCV7255279.1 hypothetical protein [Mycobacterium hackensackense]
MGSIHRVQVPVEDYQELAGLTTGPVISAAATRDGRSDVIDLWFESDAGGRIPPVPRALYIFGTGHPTPWDHWTRYAWTFINTVVTPSGLVWHIYVGPLDSDEVPG